MMSKRGRIHPQARPSSRRRAAVPTFEAVEARRLLATLTVNTTDDTVIPDATLSLREAMEVSNGTLAISALSAQEQVQVSGALSTPNTIHFNIANSGVQTINVGSALPTITNPLVIDGYTEAGARANTLAVGTDAVLLIQLTGPGSGSGQSEGLQIQAGGSLVRGLVINGFTTAIDIFTGTVGATIEGNYLGTDPAGAIARGNSGDGIFVGSSNNVIGGVAPGQRNVISASGQDGIIVSSEGSLGASGNAILGNYIGTNAAGTAALGNGGNGVFVAFGGDGTTIGGAAPGDRNVISGNAGSGVLINVGGNTVQGNLIGTDATGNAALGNTLDGISLFSSFSGNASNNQVGGPGLAFGNVLSGNGRDGLGIAGVSIYFGNFADATNNVVQGNRIGVNDAGNAPLGNGRDGLLISGASGNTIGNPVNGANIVGANARDGIAIAGAINTFDQTPVDSPNNQVRGNFLGTAAGLLEGLGNGRDGLRITRASNNTAANNTIARNAANGVTVGANLNDLSVGNQLDTNIIFANAALGIDLGDDGVTPNTPGGPHVGPNNLLNYPLLLTAYDFGDQTLVNGTLDGGVNGPFVVQIFGNPSADPSNHGQGRRFLAQVATNSNIPISVNAPAGTILSATTIDSLGDTSEFSADIVVVDAFLVTNTNDAGPGSLRQAILNSNQHAGTDTIRFAIPGQGVQIIAPTSALPTVTDSVVIDASTQPGYAGTPLVTLDGVNAGVTADGLSFQVGDSTVRGLAIGRFGGAGILLNQGSGDRIVGNYVGVAADGFTPFGNSGGGILAASAAATIGGEAPGDRNVISANLGSQIQLSFPGSQVLGNRIGTDAAGTVALVPAGNADGILILGTRDITIGGTTAGARNLISGNGGAGIDIASPTGTGIVVQGNAIGTDATGTRALGNGGEGIHLVASGITIGGTAPGAGNLISGNRGDGIHFDQAGAGSVSGGLVQGNVIGTTADGSGVLPNGIDGIRIATPGVTIGGTAPGAGNLISGNRSDGIHFLAIRQGVVSGGLVQGNFIGTGAGGAGALGNTLNGILLDLFDGVAIGGIEAGAGNTIAFNRRAGVFVNSGEGNTILSNSIFTNDGLGIQIFPGGTVRGQAPFQSFPILTSVVTVGGVTTVEGTVSGSPFTRVAIQLFANDVPDPSGYGEGQTLLGSTLVETGRFGNATFRFTVPTARVAGRFLSATATNQFGSTSEFSLNRVAVSPGILEFAAPNFTVDAVGGDVFATVTVVRNDGSDGQVSVNYATSDGDAVAGVDYVATSGTLTFAPGELAKTFRVRILDTLLLSGTRRFVVALSSPTEGAQVGRQAAATVTIVEANSLVVTNTNDDGRGSLRRAINLVNNPENTGPFAITFDIPGVGVQAIRPATALPIVAAPVTIDGYSQPGTRPNAQAVGDDAAIAILLDGSLLSRTSADSGLVFAASGNLVQGLAIGGFPVAGVVLEAGVGSQVVGNFLGTDATGRRALPNGQDGIFVVNSSYNRIGGATPGDRNVISGNGSVGVVIQGSATLGDGFPTADAFSNLLMNNYIGTDADGLAALGNGLDGVFILDASGNSIGLAADSTGNLISGNGSVGIQITGVASSRNQIFGNTLGLDATGRRALGNGTDGIFLDRANGTIVGGSATGAGNSIGGNGSVGVQVAGAGASGNVLQGNLIGTNSLGDAGLGNRTDGVFLNQAPGNLVGGAGPGEGNLISSNGFSGVEIVRASGDIVQGNRIGLALNGGALGNGAFGVLIQDAAGNTVGGAGGATNVIRFNGFAGIQVSRNGQPGGAGNALSGNTLGNNNLLNAAAGANVATGPHPLGARNIARQAARARIARRRD